MSSNSGARREGYIGEGGFESGSYQLNAFPMLTSLVTFLFSDKKVTLRRNRKFVFYKV